jgi:putative transposase
MQRTLKYRLYPVQEYGSIAVEELNVRGLAAGMAAKSAHDAGCAGSISILAYKAAYAARQLIAVDPKGPSQTCLCGAQVRKLLWEREHVSTECGPVAPRDLVAAQVIPQRAGTLPLDASAGEVMPCVI